MFHDEYEIERKYKSKSAAYYSGLLNGAYIATIVALLSIGTFAIISLVI